MCQLLGLETLIELRSCVPIASIGQIADSQTQVEAEAYAQAIRGTYLLEQERDWETALSALVRARDLYKELGTLGIGGAAALCRQRAVELEPSIRFCSYRLARARGNDGASGGELEVEMVSGDVDSVMGNRMEQLKRQLQEERAASMSAGGGADSGDGGPSSMDLRFLDVCAPCVSQELAVHLVRVGDTLGQVMAQKREQGGAKIEKEQRQAAVEKIVTNLDNATLELGAARDEVHEQLEAAKRAGAGQAATAELASAELVLRARLGVITLQVGIDAARSLAGRLNDCIFDLFFLLSIPLSLSLSLSLSQYVYIYTHSLFGLELGPFPLLVIKSIL